MGLSWVTITGRAVQSNGQPAAGSVVQAVLSAPILNGDEMEHGVWLTSTAADGSWELTVPANSDPGTVPLGTYYTVTEPLSELDSRVVVAPSPQPVNFGSLAAAPGGAGEVLSVFGRTGAVVAKAGDYTAAEVTNAATQDEVAAIPTGDLAPSRFVIPSAASAPAEPVADECYFDTTLKEIGVYSGGKWVYTGELLA